jgi:uncharacterized protein DUF4154
VRAFLLTAFLVAATAGAAIGSAPARAETAAVSERSVKAAFLYKFASYVEWPEASEMGGGPLTIGVLGSKDMAGELARITAGRTINERPVRVRRVMAGESLAGLQVLFVGEEPGAPIAKSLQPAIGLPILIVTDAPGALSRGSMINFTVERDRVRFEVSLPAAERVRLKLSSRLLAVAQRVEREPGS